MNRKALVSILAAQYLVLVHAPFAAAAAYLLPENGDSVVGAVTTLVLGYEDTLAAVAEKYQIGYRELLDANQDVDPWLPGEGTVIQLPTQYILPAAPRHGLVINVAEYRLYYYLPDGKRVITYPVGIGRSDFPTPLIETSVVGGIENPSWTPTEAARKEHAERGDVLPPVVLPGPDNPLGHLALQLAAPGYFIHGTNKPFGVGQMVSHGCIRLYSEHISTLAEIVPNGTAVFIIDEPIKLGWRGSDLYVEGHQSLYAEPQRAEFLEWIWVVAQSKSASVDWGRVDEAVDGLTGIPVRI